MTVLRTERLLLLPLSRTIIEHRLHSETFDLEVDLGSEEGTAAVHFPVAWPGDILAVFPGQYARLAPGEDIGGSFVAVEIVSGTAIGALGTKGEPDENGVVEIGYGFNPDVWGRGFATEAVNGLVAHLLENSLASVVTAQTALANRASERVLEKTGFVQVGTSWEEDDGDLIVWERREQS